jgi:ABC-type transport system involved in multi-copper enzyme maturation permease subunit
MTAPSAQRSSTTSWWRFAFRSSASLQTWHENTGDLVLVAGLALAVGLIYWLTLPWWQACAVLFGCLFPAALLNRLGWLKIFGPMLYYDMIRQGRRQRLIALRFTYCLVLALILFLVVAPHRTLTIDDGVQIAQTYFEAFLGILLVLVVFLTPAFVAGSVAEHPIKSRAARYAVIALLFLLTAVPMGEVVYYHWDDFSRPRSDSTQQVLIFRTAGRLTPFGESMNLLVRSYTAAIGCVGLLAVLVRASTGFTGERDKQTWDALLLTPLARSGILWAKWVGSIGCARWGVAWLMAIWAIGILTGGMHLLAFPVALTAWLIYAAFFASLGVWLSLVSKSSGQASMRAMLLFFVLCAGHWFFWLICPITGPNSSSLAYAHGGLLTPPFVLAMAPFTSLQSLRNEQWMICAIASTLGLGLWGFGGLLLLGRAAGRLKVSFNRD